MRDLSVIISGEMNIIPVRETEAEAKLFGMITTVNTLMDKLSLGEIQSI
jgi:hypothetical protein